jgi:hypothetical protein
MVMDSPLMHADAGKRKPAARLLFAAPAHCWALVLMRR